METVINWWFADGIGPAKIHMVEHEYESDQVTGFTESSLELSEIGNQSETLLQDTVDQLIAMAKRATDSNGDGIIDAGDVQQRVLTGTPMRR
jgi:hypothetical protein